MEKILTPSQVAHRWNCCSNTVRSAIHAGELNAFRIGKRRFGIPETAVLAYENCNLKNETKTDVENNANEKPDGSTDQD